MKLEKHANSLLLICGILLLILGIPRLIQNVWFPFSNYLFYFCLILFLAALWLKRKSLFSFLTMRNTKHGLNMGTVILLATLLFLSVNFLSTRYDKGFDVTKEKLNSLSDQTVKILDELKEEVEFRVYHQGGIDSQQNLGFKLLFKKYTQLSSKIKTKFVDAHKDPYSSELLKREDKGKVVVFVKKGRKTERVSDPVGEEALTSALYRLQKTNGKKIYFLTGHGERSISDSQEGQGVKILNESLLQKGFITAELNLTKQAKLPGDAAMIAIVGPKKGLIEKEQELLESYLKQGGRLLLALDPSAQTDYSKLANPLGVNFKQNYILTTQPVSGGDALAIVGQEFDQENDITKQLDKNSITLFYETMELEFSKTKLKHEVSNLIKTVPTTIPVDDLKNFRDQVKGKKPDVSVIAMTSKGKLSEKSKAFFFAAFGDSDFFTDLYLETGFNKDVALNAFAALSGEADLVSIRPKIASSTKMILTSVYSTFVIIFPMLIPLILLLIGSVLWFRRRGA